MRAKPLRSMFTMFGLQTTVCRRIRLTRLSKRATATFGLPRRKVSCGLTACGSRVFDSSNTEGMGGFVFTLFAASDGTLWVSSGGGLISYRDGKFTIYSAKDGLPDITIKNISEDAAGNLWLGAAGGSVIGGQGLTKFKDGRGTILTTTTDLPITRLKTVWRATLCGRFTKMTKVLCGLGRLRD